MTMWSDERGWRRLGLAAHFVYVFEATSNVHFQNKHTLVSPRLGTARPPLCFCFLLGDYPALDLLFDLLSELTDTIAVCADERDVDAALEEWI